LLQKQNRLANYVIGRDCLTMRIQKLAFTRNLSTMTTLFWEIYKDWRVPR